MLILLSSHLGKSAKVFCSNEDRASFEALKAALNGIYS